MKTLYRTGSLVTLLLAIIPVRGFAQPATNSTSVSNKVLDEFIFLPGGLRFMAARMAATNETARLALRYIGQTQMGHKPSQPPNGLTQTDISNVQYELFIWPLIISPKPIKFYGKVVDEKGEPVGGATAHIEVEGMVTNAMEWKDPPKTSMDVISDAAGLFSLTNTTGIALDVSVSKAGYYSARRNRGAQYFKYSTINLDSIYGVSGCFKPDSQHRVLYYVRKIGVGAKDLVTSVHGVRESFWVTVPKDGTPVKVDLVHQKTGNGPLEISQTKPEYPVHGGIIENLSPSDHAKLMSATNWSITMKLSDGGFVEEDDDFPFDPPESGYLPVVTYHFLQGQTNWTTSIRKDYYIKFGTPPLYGQLQMETSSRQTTVIFHYIINPDGSRNLEPRPGYFPSSSRWRY